MASLSLLRILGHRRWLVLSSAVITSAVNPVSRSSSLMNSSGAVSLASKVTTPRPDSKDTAASYTPGIRFKATRAVVAQVGHVMPLTASVTVVSPFSAAAVRA